MQTRSNLLALGIVAANALYSILRRRQLLQHAYLLGVQDVTHRDKRLANLVSILQHGEFRLGLGQLTSLQCRSLELLDLIAQPLLVLLERLRLGNHTIHLALGVAKLRIYLLILRNRLPCACQRIDSRRAERLVRENHITMLRMYIYQPHTQVAQHAELHGHIVDKRAALARWRNHTADNRLRLIVEVILLKESLQTVAIDIELSLDNAVALLIAYRATLVFIAEQQAQRTQKNRLTSTRLTSDDVQVGIKLKIEFINQSIILNSKSSQHILYL